MSRDGSDQKLWMSLILSKMEQREQLKSAAYCKLQESECSTLMFEWYLKINFSKRGLMLQDCLEKRSWWQKLQSYDS